MLRSRTALRILWSQRFTATSKNYVRIRWSNQYFNSQHRWQGTLAIEDSYVKKFMKAVGLMDQSRTRLKLSGYFIYESIPANVDYVRWFRECDLPDTLATWFCVTELHVWLIMVRCMAEDTSDTIKKVKNEKGDGYFIRNCIVEALWADVANRIKLLEGANPAIARKQVSELSEQFQAALVGYDEALEDDRVLAAAIWRRFYGMSHDTDPENVERIVKFIRHQVRIYLYFFSTALTELTVLWETNKPKDHVMKLNKYNNLTNGINRNRFKVSFYMVEVGVGGIPAKSLCNLLKDLGLDLVSNAALLGSYQIWIDREGKTCIERECEGSPKWSQFPGGATLFFCPGKARDSTSSL